MKALLEIIAQHLVTYPDAVEIRETKTDTMSVLELRVAPDDVGRVIGKHGATIDAIRTILNAAAARARRRVTLEIVESTAASPR
ncbi:MAG: putative RNA-binding protein [Deltaproteobacteria bacterium]|nr:putative RNA-binding protein [Deltaproteobacteria bacterium]